MSAHRKLLIPCSCAGCCSVLGIDDWGTPDDPDGWTVELYTRGGAGASMFRWRLKTAFNLLLGRSYYLDCVALDSEGIAKLRAFLNGEDAA